MASFSSEPTPDPWPRDLAEDPSLGFGAGSSVLDLVTPEEISVAGFQRILEAADARPADPFVVADRSVDRSLEDTLSDGTEAEECATSRAARRRVGTLEHTLVDDPAAMGRFRLLRVLAQGGLGRVYVAHDRDLDREVAVKEMQECFGDRSHARARFAFEARITGSLEHPGIVPVYGLGRCPDGRLYYAMRLIQGMTLREAIDRFHNGARDRDPGERALELRRLLTRFVDVCNTVSYAHSRGVVHRDLKPANIQLGPYGETLVVDWGLAKTVGSPSDQGRAPVRIELGETETTLDGVVIGTPSYMSPEQATGRADEIGPASDIYSLGATLYHVLTGRSPMDRTGSIMESLRGVVEGQFPAPRMVRPDIPRPLEAICLKAMALGPEDRYPSAKALAEDIERYLADEPISAFREGLPSRLARWGRRHRPVALGFVAASLMILAGALGLTALAPGRGESQHQLVAAQESLRQTNRRLAIELAGARDELGALRLQVGRRAEALAYYRQALALWEALARHHPDSAEFPSRLATTRERIRAIEGSNPDGPGRPAR